MEWIVTQLESQWSSIMDAPLIYTFIVGLCFFATWGINRFIYKHSLDTKNDTIKNKDDIIKNYQDNIHLASFSSEIKINEVREQFEEQMSEEKKKLVKQGVEQIKQMINLSNAKSEEHYKYSIDARRERAYRAFYRLLVDAEFECKSSPERMETWESEANKTIIDHLGNDVFKIFTMNKNMNSGPTKEDTKLAQNEYVRAFIEGQLRDDFTLTI